MQLSTPSGSGGGPTLTFLARHDVEAQFDDGDEGTLFKMEGIRVMTSTTGGAEGLKLFQPIGWIPSFDLTDHTRDDQLFSAKELTINPGVTCTIKVVIRNLKCIYRYRRQ